MEDLCVQLLCLSTHQSFTFFLSFGFGAQLGSWENSERESFFFFWSKGFHFKERAIQKEHAYRQITWAIEETQGRELDSQNLGTKRFPTETKTSLN